MDRADALRKLGERASDQWGLVTAAQAKLDGVQGVDLLRLERSGLLENVGRGVYRIAAAVPPEHLEVKVAWLRLDPKTPAWQRKAGDTRSGVVSHASACELHGLGDLPVDRAELTVPVRRTTRDEGVRLHLLALEADDVTVVDGLPVTTVERTIADLLRSRADGAHIGTVIADADFKGLLDLEGLAARVSSFVRAYGLPAEASGEDLLRALCDQAGRTLRSQETEQAAAAGFASAITALTSHPGVLDQLVRSMDKQQAALSALSSMPSTLEQMMDARQAVLSSLASRPNPVEQLMKNAAARDAALRAALARPNALEQLMKSAAAHQSALNSFAVRPTAVQQALAGYDKRIKALGRLPATWPSPQRPPQADMEEEG